MSLLSKKNLHLEDSNTDHGKEGEKDYPESLSRRKKVKRKFQIAESEFHFENPLLGGSGSGGGFLSSSDPNSLFSSIKSKSTSSKSNLTKPGKSVEAALASSKLSSITSDGPIEPAPRLGKRQLKAAKKHAKSLTKGPGWSYMAKTEITKEKKNDLEVLKLRSAVEGIHHYKRNNMTHTPKYFHTGTIVETKADFYSGRIPKRQRKKTLAQEFAADFGMQ